LENVQKTKEIIAFLKRFGSYDDVERVVDAKAVRPGIGKIRNHRYKLRKGPLFVYDGASHNLHHAVRNIPGVEICNVHRLNLRMLAPGGTLGRFIIWTESAFKALDKVFGSHKRPSTEKSGYHLHRTVLSHADIAKIINSDAIQSAVNPLKLNHAVHHVQKKNPLNNRQHMEFLNPYAKTAHAMNKKAYDDGKKKRQDALNAKRGISKSLTKEQKKAVQGLKKASKGWLANVQKHINDNAAADIQREKDDKEADR